MVDSPNPSPLEVFPKFPSLPPELRLKIWKYALPNPYSISSAMIMIVNLDLSKPYGFLPSPKQLEKTHKIVIQNHEGYQDYIYEPITHFDDRLGVFGMMHTCRESRTLIRATYLLEIESIVPGENTCFWKDPDDIVYFQFTRNSELIHDSMSHYLTRERDPPLYGFETLRHVAFLFDAQTRFALDYHEPFFLDIDELTPWELDLQGNFKSLESLSLFIDPLAFNQGWTTGSGKLVLFPVDETIIIQAVNRFSDEVEEKIERILSKNGSIEGPIVDLYVAVRM